MTNWFKRSVQMAYFPSKDSPLKEKWVRVRGVAERVGLSTKAKEKLEWIIFYHTFGKRSALDTSSYFGITRKTLHKWLGRFDEKNLRSLEEKSRAPIQRRSWEVTTAEEERIISLRKAHIKWGKRKIKKLYLNDYKETISTWKIERVIRKWNLYPDPKKHNNYLKIKAKRKEKSYIKDLEKKDSFGFLWHIDAIIIWWYGVRRVIFTAIEERTKIAFGRVYKTNSSQFSKDFLLRLVYLVGGKVNYIHSDNGSEFKKHFTIICKKLNIEIKRNPVKHPTSNGKVERMHRTIEEECFWRVEAHRQDISYARYWLSRYLAWYNTRRKHGGYGMNGRTPPTKNRRLHPLKSTNKPTTRCQPNPDTVQTLTFWPF